MALDAKGPVDSSFGSQSQVQFEEKENAGEKQNQSSRGEVDQQDFDVEVHEEHDATTNLVAQDLSRFGPGGQENQPRTG